MKTGFCTLTTFGLLLVSLPGLHAEPWKRHTIDKSSRGADGVRLADVNGDGLQDIHISSTAGKLSGHDRFSERRDSCPK